MLTLKQASPRQASPPFTPFHNRQWLVDRCIHSEANLALPPWHCCFLENPGLASPPFIFPSITEKGLLTIAFRLKQASSHLRGVVASSENILRRGETFLSVNESLNAGEACRGEASTSVSVPLYSPFTLKIFYVNNDIQVKWDEG
jgi:hypothetical protein